MQIKDILETYNFKEDSENTFKRDYWEVRFEGNTFELFSDPEIDVRYYIGSIDNLEKYLKEIS